MTEEPPSFNLASILSAAAALANEHGVEVKVSRHGAISIKPQRADSEVSSAALRMRKMRAKKNSDASDACDACDACYSVTPVTPVTPVTNNVTAPSLPPSPLSPHTPLSPAPTHTPGHPSTHTRVRPSVEQARSAAMELGITPDEAESWWLAREASEWMRSSNGALTPVGNNWRADAKTYVTNERQRKQERQQRGSYANGSSKPQHISSL